MRFIPTRYHAPLDYIVGAVLIAAPWLFSFSDIAPRRPCRSCSAPG
jgi:hypothetical protein